ncbi:arginase family protein [Holzapfeliella sp. He02]|uniref:Arginase family protein n=1 Tax=Holzapfeliella saturejae TaxID=3082953 RepID=A0ABU8SIY3_9LACO
MTKTLRLIAPDWQGGNRPEYYTGAELLTHLVPKNNHQQEVRLDIAPPTKTLTTENGVFGQSDVLNNMRLAQEAIEANNPDKIITLGGTCLVSQAPFDYLSGEYGEDLGVIWIDAHPDVSNPELFTNEHAMVLGNLVHQGDPKLQKEVQHPLSPNSVLYVGLQEPNDDEKVVLNQLNIASQVSVDIEAIQKWISQHQFKKLAIHFDLDALSPELFHSTYFSEPGKTDYPASSGALSLLDVGHLLEQLSETNDIVGLTVAEYLPWDAIALKKLFNKLPIFKD